MRLSLEYYLSSFFGLYMTFYSLTIILIIIGTTFLRKHYKTESFNLLYAFNTLAAWSNLMIFIFLFEELFISWYGQNSYEWYALRQDRLQISWTIFFIYNLSVFLLGLLFFFRKLRKSKWFTLFFFLLRNIFLFVTIVLYVMNQFRDYLPSNWSTYYDETHYFRYICSYAIILLWLTLIYLRANKKGRLPFPSVFLK
jgi:hypothetical protein